MINEYGKSGYNREVSIQYSKALVLSGQCVRGLNVLHAEVNKSPSDDYLGELLFILRLQVLKPNTKLTKPKREPNIQQNGIPYSLSEIETGYAYLEELFKEE